jgi:hypothetical protein
MDYESETVVAAPILTPLSNTIRPKTAKFQPYVNNGG